MAQRTQRPIRDVLTRTPDPTSVGLGAIASRTWRRTADPSAAAQPDTALGADRIGRTRVER